VLFREWSPIAVRAYNCLYKEDIRTIGDLVECTEEDLLDIRNFGAACLREVLARMEDCGLSLKVISTPAKSTKPRTYSLTINEEQARVIKDALHLFARIHIGQFDFIHQTIFPHWEGHPPPTFYRPLEDKLRQAIFSHRCANCRGAGHFISPDGLKHDCTYCEGSGYAALMPTNGSYGINSPARPDECRVAWDIYALIRHRLSHDALRPGEKPGYTVNFDPPRQFSQQPLAKIEKM
jgi:hypothetical protein